MAQVTPYNETSDKHRHTLTKINQQIFILLVLILLLAEKFAGFLLQDICCLLLCVLEFFLLIELPLWIFFLFTFA